jgi:hypothetical protein
MTMPLPDATEQPLVYRDALLELAADRDPLAVMAQTPVRVAELMAGRDAADLARPPAPGEWSAAAIVGHMVDVQMVFSFRWRMALTADRPAYLGYDEKRWSELAKPSADRLLATLRALREYDLTLLRSIPAGAWDRVGVHGEQGPETVTVMVRKLAGHDLVHLAQLEQALGA